MQAIKFASVFIHFIVLSLRRNCDFAKMCSLVARKLQLLDKYVMKFLKIHSALSSDLKWLVDE